MKKLMSKKLTKAIVLAACALLLVAGTVMGTVAYLTSTQTVSNTFTYGNVAITMSEEKTTNKLVPGQTYEKDTTISVEAGSETCYLFAKVESVNNVTYTFAENWESMGNGVYYYKVTVDANTNVQVLKSLTYSAEAKNPSGSETTKETITGYAVQAAGFTTAADAWNATFGKPADPQA